MINLLHEISINTKNVEETFAECFAQYCLKKKLPEAYHSLMEKSLSVAKASNKE